MRSVHPNWPSMSGWHKGILSPIFVRKASVQARQPLLWERYKYSSSRLRTLFSLSKPRIYKSSGSGARHRSGWLNQGIFHAIFIQAHAQVNRLVDHLSTLTNLEDDTVHSYDQIKAFQRTALPFYRGLGNRVSFGVVPLPVLLCTRDGIQTLLSH